MAANTALTHVHVTGPNFRASVAIVGGTILTGALPAQVLREVQHAIGAPLC